MATMDPSKMTTLRRREEDMMRQAEEEGATVLKFGKAGARITDIMPFEARKQAYWTIYNTYIEAHDFIAEQNAMFLKWSDGKETFDGEKPEDIPDFVHPDRINTKVRHDIILAAVKLVYKYDGLRDDDDVDIETNPQIKKWINACYEEHNKAAKLRKSKEDILSNEDILSTAKEFIEGENKRLKSIAVSNGETFEEKKLENGEKLTPELENIAVNILRSKLIESDRSKYDEITNQLNIIITNAQALNDEFRDQSEWFGGAKSVENEARLCIRPPTEGWPIKGEPADVRQARRILRFERLSANLFKTLTTRTTSKELVAQMFDMVKVREMQRQKGWSDAKAQQVMTRLIERHTKAQMLRIKKENPSL